MSLLANSIRLMRPSHSVKNLFIFTPLFFAGHITDTALLIKAMLAFIAFSLCASAVYIFNDVMDADADRKHQKKKKRPIASGMIKPTIAMMIMAGVIVVGLLLMALTSTKALAVILAYIAMNIAYSFRLKHIAIVDVVIIASGFVMRIFVGSFATQTSLSIWIVLMTFLLALFMALGKRRDDVLLFEQTGQKMRQVIEGYSLKFIDAAMMMMASVVIVTYILYTTSAEVLARLHNNYLYITTLFVIVGVLRYMQIVFVQEKGGSPTQIALGDRFIQTTLLLWIVVFAWILYG